MRQRWLSRRAILAHVAALATVGFCLFAGWWQLTRARSGNAISWAYAVQWPIFAVVGAVMWWQVVHHPPTAEQPAAESDSVGLPKRKRETEDPALREYNDQLEFLGAFGRRKTWRNPTGQP
ncbi:MAG: hypothetical protein M3179_06935 [Actinomycetota bacterium]|nr:hypothetical protein [Actinomycetota bacterium]